MIDKVLYNQWRNILYRARKGTLKVEGEGFSPEFSSFAAYKAAVEAVGYQPGMKVIRLNRSLGYIVGNLGVKAGKAQAERSDAGQDISLSA